MRTQLRVGVGAAVLFGAAVLHPAPALADNNAPRLTSAQRTSPANAEAGFPVTIAWSAEDDAEVGSGVYSATFHYDNKDGAGKVIAWAEPGGDYLPLADGRSVAAFVLGPWAGSGHYALEYIDVFDRAANLTRYRRDGSVETYTVVSNSPPPAPFDFAALDFDVANPHSDTAAGTVQDISMVQRNVLAGQPVTLTSKVSDDVSGAADFGVTYTSPSGSRVFGTGSDAVLAPAGLSSGVVPLGAEGGHWLATAIGVVDRAGNKVVYRRDRTEPELSPAGIHTHSQQPALDFTALDIDVTPVQPDTAAPSLSGLSREGPAQLHRGDDVVMHYSTADASALKVVSFSFFDQHGHSVYVMNQCVPERGLAVDQVPEGVDAGPVRLNSVMVTDAEWNSRDYRRDGTVWSQGQLEAGPGLDLSAFDFELVDGAASYTGHPHTRFGCPAVAKVPLLAPSTAAPGDVITVSGQVLNPVDQPISNAEVAVFQQLPGQEPALITITTADPTGHFSVSTSFSGETAYLARFLGRAGQGGADATTSERSVVRTGSGGSDGPTSGPASPAPTPAPTPTATSSPPTGPQATPGGGSTTASPSNAATGPTATPRPEENAPTLTMPSAITYGAAVPVTGRGTPGADYELWAYSRPSMTYRLVRTGTVDSLGSWTATVRPATNTRMFVRTRGGSGWLSSPTRAVQVRSAVTLRVSTASTGARRTFAGAALPAAAGRLVSIYRTGASGPQLFAQVRTTSTGAYTTTAAAPHGRAVFDARTSATDRNAAGISRGVATS